MKPSDLEELSGWEEVIEQAGHDNSPSRAQAQARSAKKISFAIANLGQSVFGVQKQVSRRLESLTTEIQSSGESSDRLTKAANRLSLVIALAAVAQVVVTVIK